MTDLSRLLGTFEWESEEPSSDLDVVADHDHVVVDRDDHDAAHPPLGTLLDQTAAFLRRFVVLNDHQQAAGALWVLHTHAIAAADATPYVFVSSAEKRSGKTRLLEVLELLVKSPLATANISDAALFRAISELQPTLLFDEIDAIFGPKARDREDLRGMLNAGYRRGAVVRRMGGAKMTTLESFEVFSAKVFAGIGTLPDTLRDRSITIRMERRTRDEEIERFRRRNVEAEADELRQQIETVALAHAHELAATDPDLPDELDDRQQDCWEPLLAIADLAGGHWPRRARSAALALSTGAAADDDSLGARLLSDIRDVFESHGPLSTTDLIGELAKIEESPWGDWKGKPITAHKLSALLKPYSIKTMSVRSEGEVVRGYKAEQFTNAWLRVLGVTSVTRVTSGSNSQAGCNARNACNASTTWEGAEDTERARLFDQMYPPAKRELPNAEVRRLLSVYRPELIGRDDVTTQTERRQIASMLAAQERAGLPETEELAA